MAKRLLVISSYPAKGETHSRQTVGVASYTKKLLTSVKKTFPALQLTMFAEYFTEPVSYQEEGIKIERIWKRGDFISTLNLSKKIVFAKEEKILISFEAYMFGNFINVALILLSLSLSRFMGKKTFVLLHQVVTNVDSLKQSNIKKFVLNLLLPTFFLFIYLSSSKVIVFEEGLRKKLPWKKVKVLPHLIPEVQMLPKIKARKDLGFTPDKKYILYFGYIAPYKGILELVNNWPKKTHTLVVAGDINPNHKGNKETTEYIKKVKDTAGKKTNIILTGFVPEENIPLYFSACDAVILPYKTFMSSSGPLALALAYKKPILVSSELKTYAQTQDIAKALSKGTLTIEDMAFVSSAEGIKGALSVVFSKEKEFVKFADQMSKERSSEKIAAKLISILNF